MISRRTTSASLLCGRGDSASPGGASSASKRTRISCCKRPHRGSATPALAGLHYSSRQGIWTSILALLAVFKCVRVLICEFQVVDVLINKFEGMDICVDGRDTDALPREFDGGTTRCWFHRCVVVLYIRGKPCDVPAARREDDARRLADDRMNHVRRGEQRSVQPVARVIKC